MSLARLSTLAGLVLLGACAASPGNNPSATSPTTPLVGGDRDAHGCIASAGYRWCERTQACERPWELAGEKGFELEETTFETYCDKPR